ncbi:MAG: UvrB/UvrC motif-containing protein [Patescibacteria group bacterium]
MSSKIAVNKLPDQPGVYFFKRGREILYIGKATSLRDRVRSYFAKEIGETRGPKIEQMLALATRVDYRATESVLEALILESNLIKEHQPIYNSREKDDKSFYYVLITKEAWPRVLLERGSNLLGQNQGEVFGPYPHGNELKEALKIIRRIFPFRDKCAPESGRPCFNRQIGLCPGVCSGEITPADYAKIIRHLRLFFQGKKKSLLALLQREMKLAARKQNFEQAARLRNQIFALEHIQDVSLLKRTLRMSDMFLNMSDIRLEAYDVAHLSGKNTVGVMTVITAGELDKASYRKFKLRGVAAEKSDDTANLREILERRFSHPEWPKPDLIIVDGGQAQINVATQIISLHKLKIPVIGVVKDDKHKAGHLLGRADLIRDYHREIILANAEAHRFAITYHRQLRGRMI